MRWEREERRTLGETETSDKREKWLPTTQQDWIWKSSAARKRRPHVKREGSLWHERGGVAWEWRNEVRENRLDIP